MAGIATLRCDNPALRLQLEVPSYFMACAIALLVVQRDGLNSFAAPSVLSNGNIWQMAIFAAGLVKREMRLREITSRHVEDTSARKHPRRINNTYDEAKNTHPSLPIDETIERDMIMSVELCCALPAVFLHPSPCGSGTICTSKRE